MNKWKCPECAKVVDYGDCSPSDGNTYCSATGKSVQMVKIGCKACHYTGSVPTVIDSYGPSDFVDCPDCN
jgi:hypothetical protein